MAHDLRTLSPASVVTPQRPTSPATGLSTLSVVIVNYRQWEETGALVRQLLATSAVREGRAEIVIVDNHSPAHPLVKKLRRMPQVSIRRYEKNYGFAKAVNEGCRLSQGEWFLLLNPDTTLTDGFLDSVVELAGRAEMRTGIVGFHLRNSDGSQQLSAGLTPTFASSLLRLAMPRRKRKYMCVRGLATTPVPWVTGCCMLVRGSCLQELGGLDARFFLYYEDVDLCLRARERGWGVCYEPTLTAIHHHPLHARTTPAPLRLVTRHSLLTFAAKHWPAWQTRMLARMIRGESWLRRLAAWWKGDTQEGLVFREMQALASDFLAGDYDRARMRLERAVERRDLRVGV